MTAMAKCPDSKGDPRVRVVAPAERQQFAPGDTVDVTVRSTVALAAGWVAVGGPGLGVLEGQGWNGSTYQARFVIPSDYAQLGPLEITPDVMDTAGQPIEGVCVTVIVRIPGAPQSLLPVNKGVESLFKVGASTQIYVHGHYSGRKDADLTSPTTGTRYTSSDTNVVTVDDEGHVRATGFGTAVVTATNSGVRMFVPIVVEDIQHPLPPQDLTAKVAFRKSPLRLDDGESGRSKSPVYVQTITVTNTTPLPIVGPLYLVFKEIPKDVYVYGVSPARMLYRRLKPMDGLTIQPDESVSTSLQFAMPSPTEPAYKLELVRTRGNPQDLVDSRSVAGPTPVGAKPSPSPGMRVVTPCLAIVGPGGSDNAGATITNKCSFPVTYTFCYSGGTHTRFDCKIPMKGEGLDSLDAGQGRDLPQYNGKGILIIACRADETPVLDQERGWGCYR